MKSTVFFGPPGTGKTTSLLNTVETLFDEGFQPHEIAVVSFTRKASNEVKTRAQKQFPDLPDSAWKYWATLHSICFARLRLQRSDVMGKDDWKWLANKTGFPMKGYYSMDDGQLAGGTLEGDQYLFHNGLARARMMDPLSHFDSLHPTTVGHTMNPVGFSYFVEQLRAYKNETGLKDFDDMLEGVLPYGPIEHLRVAIIDEAQDLSKMQWRVALTLFANVDRLYVAGDDDQAIFEWSGADVPSFLKFAESANRVLLDKSWRVPPQIQKLAQNIIGRIPTGDRYEKNWHAAEHDGRFSREGSMRDIRDLILEDDDESWMMLARNNYLLDDFKDELIAWGIPISVKGVPLVKPQDVAAIRTYERVRKGGEIGASEAQRMYRYLLGNGKQITRGFKQLPGDMPEIVNWDSLSESYGLLVDRNDPWFDAFQHSHGRKSWEHDKAYMRRILRHGGNLLDEKPKLNLSSIHGEKGGEADNVILIDAMSGRSYREYTEINPSQEHRVQYVAVTRARKNLFLVPHRNTGGLQYAY